MWFGEVLDPDGIKTEPLSTFLASSLNVELVHVILKGIKKFSNIKMQQPQIADLDITQEEAEDFLEQQEKQSYELMRICRLNRIKIKNPEKWDKANYEHFVENSFIESSRN